MAQSEMFPDPPGEVAESGSPHPLEQRPIPKDRRTEMLKLADSLEASGVKTPQAVALFLDEISPKLRTHAQALWDLMAAAGVVESGAHEWSDIYAVLDRPLPKIEPMTGDRPEWSTPSDESHRKVQPGESKSAATETRAGVANAGLSLTGFLASIALEDVVKKDFGPDEYVLFPDYMVRAGFLFQIGAVLGYTFRDRLPIFAQLLAAAGAEQRVISLLQEQAADRLNSAGGSPSDFAAMYFAPEATRLIGILRDAGMTTARDWLDMVKVASQRLRVEDIFTQLQMAPAEGFGFGSRYPKLTADLLAAEIDDANYQRWSAAGLDISTNPPKRKSMQEWREIAVSLIRPHVEQVRPDLVSTLGL